MTSEPTCTPFENTSVVMSVAAIPRDSVAVNSRAFKQVTVERDVTTARDDNIPKGGSPHGSERKTDGRRRAVLDQLVQEIHHCKVNVLIRTFHMLTTVYFLAVEPRSPQANQLSQRYLNHLDQNVSRCLDLLEKCFGTTVILDERNQLLDVLQRNLEDIKSEK